LPWYAVRTNPTAERSAARRLDELPGVLTFLPLLRDPRCRLVPLFPSYLFILADLDRLGPVLRTQGVAYVLGTRFNQQPVRAGLVESLVERQAQLGVVIDERPAEVRWQPGDVARVLDGAFAGLSGRVLAARRDQVRLHLLLFGRETETTLPARALEAA